MTYDDFQRSIRDIFRRSPLVPAVLDLQDGRRIIADMPEELEARASGVMISRRTDSTLLQINYAEIDRVTPLDELPTNNGGLSYADFYRAVRPLLWREPYQPFTLELRDGTKLLIDSPGRLSLAGRFGVFLPPAAAPIVRFTYDQVVRVSTSDMARAG